MPLAAAAVPLITAGAGVVSQGINAFSQGSMNRKTRKWNEKMYGIQRGHALEDWNRQNAYNSPEQQMQRLIAAGLNPNLVYDNGATHTAAPVRSTNMDAWRPEAPRFDLATPVAQGLMLQYDMELKQAQTDNLKQQNMIAVQDAAIRAADAVIRQVGGKIKNEQDAFDLGLAKDLRSISLESKAQELRKLQADTQFTLNQDERAAAMNAANLQRAAEEILSIRAQRAKTGDEQREIEARIRNLEKDGRLKQLDIELKEKGIQPGDAIWWRILSRIIEKVDITPSDFNGSKKGIAPWRKNP